MAGGICGREGMHGKWAWLEGGVHGIGHAWQGGVHCRGVVMAGESATGADGNHPTGMHSCF